MAPPDGLSGAACSSAMWESSAFCFTGFNVTVSDVTELSAACVLLGCGWLGICAQNP